MTFANRLLLNYQIRCRNDHLFEGPLPTCKTLGINLKTRNKKISHDCFSNYDQCPGGLFKIPRDEAYYFEIRKCGKCISKGQWSDEIRYKCPLFTAYFSIYLKQLEEGINVPVS